MTTDHFVEQINAPVLAETEALLEQRTAPAS
jgi:hypothetical protein